MLTFPSDGMRPLTLLGQYVLSDQSSVESWSGSDTKRSSFFWIPSLKLPCGKNEFQILEDFFITFTNDFEGFMNLQLRRSEDSARWNDPSFWIAFFGYDEGEVDISLVDHQHRRLDIYQQRLARRPTLRQLNLGKRINTQVVQILSKGDRIIQDSSEYYWTTHYGLRRLLMAPGGTNS